jgi:hypothetical protein
MCYYGAVSKELGCRFQYVALAFLFKNLDVVFKVLLLLVKNLDIVSNALL